VDLDSDTGCAPPLCEQWIPGPAPFLCFRVAVREVEAWLMADAEDAILYEYLVIVDAIRGGRARERESAIKELKMRFSQWL
jgi:hypothetical protein